MPCHFISESCFWWAEAFIFNKFSLHLIISFYGRTSCEEKHPYSEAPVVLSYAILALMLRLAASWATFLMESMLQVAPFSSLWGRILCTSGLEWAVWLKMPLTFWFWCFSLQCWGLNPEFHASHTMALSLGWWPGQYAVLLLTTQHFLCYSALASQSKIT